jgi:hypothetical protein
LLLLDAIRPRLVAAFEKWGSFLGCWNFSLGISRFPHKPEVALQTTPEDSRHELL